jgi:hypothetical protein
MPTAWRLANVCALGRNKCCRAISTIRELIGCRGANHSKPISFSRWYPSASYIQGFVNSSYNNFVTTGLTLDTNSYYPSYSAFWYIGPGRQGLMNNTFIPSAAYEITILNYSSTTQTKQGHYIGGGQSANDRNQLNLGAFDINITSPVLSVGFYVANSWIAGTTMEIYGEGPLT